MNNLIHTKYKSLALFILFALSSSFMSAQAQSNNKDFESWNTLAFQFKPLDKISLALEQQARFQENGSKLEQYFTQFEANYECFKNFQIGSEFRYITKNDTKGKQQGYKYRFRYQINLLYKQKIKALTLKYKLAYQNRNELGLSLDQGDIAKENIRFKVGLAYNIKKWYLDPKVSAEIFNTIGSDDPTTEGFSKYRFTIGTSYKIKKIGEISFFYRFEKEINVDLPLSSDILGLKFAYVLKN